MKPFKLFLIITTSIIVAALIWFIFLPLIFNVGPTIFIQKDVTKLTAFSQEAFAYDLGSGYEVDASVRIKGFEQKNEEDKYQASIFYSVDLVTPNIDTLKTMFSKTSDKSSNEKITDIPLEAQFDLDSTAVKGKYKVLYNIKDKYSGQAITSSVNLNVE